MISSSNWFLRFGWVTIVLSLMIGLTRPAAAQNCSSNCVEGVSEILSSTSASEIDTWSETYISPDVAYYYDARVDGFLSQNGTLIADGCASANYAEDGCVPAAYSNDAYGEISQPLVVGDTYEIESDHYLIAFYTYGYDSYGDPEYYNPDQFLSNDGGSLDPSGSDFTPGGGPIYYDTEYIYLGTTAVEISSAAPYISGVNPNSGTIGTGGSITVTGTDLIDVFTATTTPAITGSGISLSVASGPTSTQVVLNYTISSNASAGAYSLTVSTRFGTSNSVTFNVGYPPAVVTNITPSAWTAGLNTSVTITGRGFGNGPTLSVSGARVSLTLNSASPDGTTIQATATVAPNAPSQTVTVTVQPGYVGSSFVCNCQGQSPNGTNTATTQPVTPVPQIMFNGGTISGTTQPVMAGQQIILSVPTPSGYTIQGQSWSFSNQAAITGGFKNTAGTGQPSAAGGGQELADPSLTQNSLTFYWVNPGDNGEQVTYTYTLDNNQQASATATFNIDGPAGDVLPSASLQTDDSATVLLNPQGDPAGFKMGNSPGNFLLGIQFTDLATLPSNNGTFIWVQILKSVAYSQITPFGSSYVPPPNKTTGLDGIYPYPSNAFPSSRSTTSDSPGIRGLPVELGEAAEAFDATIYVLWDPTLPSGCTPATTDTSQKLYKSTPSSCTSVPVPLGSIHWKWNACVINQLGPPEPGSSQPTPSWFRHCGPASADAAVPSGYPEWNACEPSFHADCNH